MKREYLSGALSVLVLTAAYKARYVCFTFIFRFEEGFVLCTWVEGRVLVLGYVADIAAFDIRKIVALSFGNLVERHKFQAAPACIENGIVICIETVAASHRAGRRSGDLVNSLADRACNGVAVKIIKFAAARLANSFIASLCFGRHW
jgi:hypothetical protein